MYKLPYLELGECIICMWLLLFTLTEMLPLWHKSFWTPDELISFYWWGWKGHCDMWFCLRCFTDGTNPPSMCVRYSVQQSTCRAQRRPWPALWFMVMELQDMWPSSPSVTSCMYYISLDRPGWKHSARVHKLFFFFYTAYILYFFIHAYRANKKQKKKQNPLQVCWIIAAVLWAFPGCCLHH